MNSERNKFLLVLALAAAALFYVEQQQQKNKCPDGRCPLPPPSPAPFNPFPPSPKPPTPPPPKPWEPDDSEAGRSTRGVIFGNPVKGTKTSPDGTVDCLDLPQSEKKHNVGGRDGAGLCVFTSIEYSARWSNERRLYEFQNQMRKEPGGGHPEKVEKMMAKYAPGVAYIQDTTGDYELLKAAIKSGRMPSVTYNGYDPHYRGPVAHMVSCAWADDRWACVTDNNFPQDSEHIWMSPADFVSRFKGGGGGWSVILLNPGPPPVPIN